MTRQLLIKGETVRRLVMIDSPYPGTLPPLPEASLDSLEQAGVFQALKKEQVKVSDLTRSHFLPHVNAYNH